MMEFKFDVEELKQKVVDQSVKAIFATRYDDDGDEFAPRINVEAAIKKAVAEKLETLVDEDVRSAINAQLVKVVDGACAKGWHPVDEYGRRGPLTTISAVISNRLATFTKGNGRHGEASMQGIVSAKLKEFTTREVTKAAADGLAKFRESIDAAVGAKLNETLRKALGI